MINYHHSARRISTPLPDLDVDFDVGEPEVIEQQFFEMEDITLTGDENITVVEMIPDVTVSGEHRVVVDIPDKLRENLPGRKPRGVS